jgi:hypothetical protein
LVAGVVTWLFGLAVKVWVVEPIFCHSTDSFAVCANGGSVAFVVGLVFAHLLGLALLVRGTVYRPLLVVVATVVTLYGIDSWLGVLSALEATLWWRLLSGWSSLIC